MKPERALAEVTYPLRSAACALAMLTFYLLIALAVRAGLLGLWLAVLVLPALCRYLVTVADARATGAEVEPPGIELFTLGSQAWTFFTLLPALALAGLAFVLDPHPLLEGLVAVLAALLLPAMLAVLVITHSPLQALNPAAHWQLARRLGPSYLWASALLGVVVILSNTAWSGSWAGRLLFLYLLFALHALVGGLVSDHGLASEIDLPEDPAHSIALAEQALQRERRTSLNHAYALFSRGNAAGAMSYLGRWLAEDPDPGGARDWFQDHMAQWEDKVPALVFGQSHLAALLERGDTVRAVKLMLRLRLLDSRFRPADGDLPAAIAAARSTGNVELAAALEARESGTGSL